MSQIPQLSRIQELVYEIKTEEVMTRDVATVTPQTSMSELRDILRTRRIAGTPVLSGDRLVGIISIEDLINWLSSGSPDATVGERMTQDVMVGHEDEPLVHVVARLDRYGYGRLPIVERESGKLVGVITKGDIAQGLMRKLEVGYQEEEVRSFRASHIFDDIIADAATLLLRYKVAGKDFKAAGSGATRMKKTLSRLGIEPRVLRRIAIVTYEAEMNIVIYTNGGELAATVEPGMITIEATDNGPGIPDVEQALTAGYSTAADWVRELGFGAGMGLCNIKRCADDMSLESAVGTGTRLEARIEVPEGLHDSF